jgi:phospholipid/cholesterol/gamma-HCH transport system substrate-binding protein
MKLSREFKIGFVAVIAVALALWGINYLKGINIFKSTDHYYAVYKDVKGLVENAVVYLNGYKVGQVSKIEFDENNIDKIVVDISLEKNLKLKKNTSLVIRSGSLISGSKDIDIIPGEGPGYYEPGDTLLSSVQVELTDYIDPIRAKIESVVTAIDTVMLALSDLMDETTRKNLQGTIANLNGATSSLKTSLQPSGSLSQSLNNLGSVTENLKKNNEDITKILKNFAAVSDTLKQADLKALINHASETFARTSELFTAINSGKGTAGQLIVNDSVYHNLNNALSSLDSLLIDLREHPKRYVHLSVFGKKDR